MTDDRDDSILRLGAALDGELDAIRALELEREIAGDPALAAEYRRLATLRQAVRRCAPLEAAPPALAARIASLAEAGAGSPPVFRARRPGWASARPYALAASMAAMGFAVGVGLMSLRTQTAAEGVAQSLVADFARAQIAGQPFDVASSDRHTVKPWLAGRTTVSADIVDLASQGFPLAGGRVAVVDKIPAPTLVYRHNEHLVAVTELPLDAPGARRGGGIETVDGYHIARWSDPNLAYVAVSDMDERTLAQFVAAFHEAAKPAAEERR
jgi:anti-sigma factor RsiW